MLVANTRYWSQLLCVSLLSASWLGWTMPDSKRNLRDATAHGFQLMKATSVAALRVVRHEEGTVCVSPTMPSGCPQDV